MENLIDQFILYLATERGLSDNYQISTRLSLEGFTHWLERRKIVAAMGEAALEQLLKDLDQLEMSDNNLHDPLTSTSRAG